MMRERVCCLWVELTGDWVVIVVVVAVVMVEEVDPRVAAAIVGITDRGRSNDPKEGVDARDEYRDTASSSSSSSSTSLSVELIGKRPPLE